MDEQTISAEERLKQLNEERKELKVKVKGERDLRLERAAKLRATRDVKIVEVQSKLKEIQAAIFKYNKLGKVGKFEFDVLGKILKALDLNHTSV